MAGWQGRKGMMETAGLWPVWFLSWKPWEVLRNCMSESVDHLTSSSIICLAPGLQECKDQDLKKFFFI